MSMAHSHLACSHGAVCMAPSQDGAHLALVAVLFAALELAAAILGEHAGLVGVAKG